MALAKSLVRSLIHSVTRTRQFYYRQVARLAADTHKRTILELGSGKAVKGVYTYSARSLFPADNEFVMSDINPTFGHQVVDVTTMTYRSKFDVILCLNVLEHVYDYQTALAHLHRALKKHGTLVIAVPFAFPLHDEPGDYWRFTEHTLRRLVTDSGLTITRLSHRGKRELPFGYYLEATK